MNKPALKRDGGQVMLMVIILILVMMVIIVASLMTSRTSIKLSADFRGKTSLFYKAEEGINRTLSRFVSTTPSQTGTSPWNLTAWKGYVTCDSNNTAFPTNAELAGSIDCAFINDTKEGLLVIVSRRPDHCQKGKILNATVTTCELDDKTDGRVYLVNSIASDKAGRQEVDQAVIIAPYATKLTANASGGLVYTSAPHPYKKPYLASIVRGGTHTPQLAQAVTSSSSNTTSATTSNATSTTTSASTSTTITIITTTTTRTIEPITTTSTTGTGSTTTTSIHTPTTIPTKGGTIIPEGE